MSNSYAAHRCPWCNELPWVVRASRDRGAILSRLLGKPKREESYFVACENQECPVSPRTRETSSAESALEKWNQRAL